MKTPLSFSTRSARWAIGLCVALMASALATGSEVAAASQPSAVAAVAPSQASATTPQERTAADLAAAAAARGTAAFHLSGLTVDVTDPALPVAPVADPSAADSNQVSSVATDTPYSRVAVEAFPFGTYAEAEALQAAPGSAAQLGTKLATLRAADGDVVVGHPSVSLFGHPVAGLLTRGTDATDPALGPVLLGEWTTEYGNRLWVVRAEAAASLTAQPSTTLAVALDPTSASPTATSAAARGITANAVTPQVTTAQGPTIPYPSWWTGGTCNSSVWKGAALLFEWGTFPVCSPGDGAHFTTYVPPGGSMSGFQCVELSLRWMYQAYGVPAYLANGNTIYGHYSGTLLAKIPNNKQGTPGPVPQPGDVLSIGIGEAFGHTDIVYKTTVDTSGNGTIYTIDENAGAAGSLSYAVAGWHVVSSRGIIGWLHSSKVVTGDGSYVRTPDTHIYRLAGGAPVAVYNCADLGGCSLITAVPNLSQFNTVPVGATFVHSVETNLTYRIVGGAPVRVSSWDAYGGPQPTINVNAESIATLDHLNAVPSDGTFISIYPSRAIYRTVGGAPVRIPTWTPFGGSQPTVTIPQASLDSLDHMNAVPADGEFIQGAETGNVYRFAGGAPIRILDWRPFGGTQSSTIVNQASIDGLDHMNATPANGTYLESLDNADTIYRVAGGAPLLIGTSWTAVGGPQPFVGVDDVDIRELDHLHAVPVDGTFISTSDTHLTYRIAGGAPLLIPTWAAWRAVPQPTVPVPSTTITTLDHMNAHPPDGTFLVAGDTGRIFRVVGGAPLSISSWTALGGVQASTTVDQATIDSADHMSLHPADGTYLNTADTGRQYRIAGDAPLQVSTWGPLGGPAPSMTVTQGTIDGLYHLAAYPTNGEYLYTGDTKTTYRVAGGAAITVTNCGELGGCADAVTIEQSTITTLDHLRAQPLDGTVVASMPSGTHWQFQYGRRRQVAATTTSATSLNDVTMATFVKAPDIYIADTPGHVRSAWTPAVGATPVAKGDNIRGIAAIPGGGYTVDEHGVIHAFGDATPETAATTWSGDIVRGIAVAPNGHSGYVLDLYGGLHPFGGAPAVTTSAYWSGHDLARGIVLRSDGVSGYVLDGWGGVHPFGGAPTVAVSVYWKGWSIARSIVLRPDGQSGYVLDGFGGIHPFGGAPVVARSEYWAGWDIARGITMLPGATNEGYVVDAYGGLHPFGGAPAIAASGYTSGQAIVVGIASV